MLVIFWVIVTCKSVSSNTWNSSGKSQVTCNSDMFRNAARDWMRLPASSISSVRIVICPLTSICIRSGLLFLSAINATLMLLSDSSSSSSIKLLLIQMRILKLELKICYVGLRKTQQLFLIFTNPSFFFQDISTQKLIFYL